METRFLGIFLEELLHPLSLQVALSACEQPVPRIEPHFQIPGKKLLCRPKERPLAAYSALDSTDEYGLLLEINVGELEQRGFRYPQPIQVYDPEESFVPGIPDTQKEPLQLLLREVLDPL